MKGDFTMGNNNMNMNRSSRVSPRNENNSSNNSQSACRELLKAIMEADFFAQDLKLYLDTHPDDEKAVGMFREAVKQSKACKKAFEESFYPLTAHSSGKNGEWDWLCGEFPPQS